MRYLHWANQYYYQIYCFVSKNEFILYLSIINIFNRIRGSRYTVFCYVTLPPTSLLPSFRQSQGQSVYISIQRVIMQKSKVNRKDNLAWVKGLFDLLTNEPKNLEINRGKCLASWQGKIEPVKFLVFRIDMIWVAGKAGSSSKLYPHY